MGWLKHEMRLIVRNRMTLAALVLLCLLSALSVYAGLQEIKLQTATISRVNQLNDEEVATMSKGYVSGGDAGYAAYYTFYTTSDLPSDTAFLALGLRDVAPYMLRIRALGLQAQLYEGETFNPELALPGKFDFAFVLVYLSPLFVIALLHDILSSERQSGRLRLLLAMSGTRGRLWYRRIGLRIVLLLLALLLPVIAGTAFTQVLWGHIAMIALMIVAYLLFWSGLCLLVNARNWRSSTNAMTLMGCWVVLTLIIPTLVNVVMLRAIPVNQGVDLMLTQRQNINGAWDLPREETLARFTARYPEWKDTAPLTEKFHWKWYYAFHQLGDESVAPQAQRYREGLLQRDAWTSGVGAVLPGVGVQVLLHRLAATDLQAQLTYQDNIAAFHQKIRTFYYPYVFHDKPFDQQDFASRPVFASVPQTGGINVWLLLACLGISIGCFTWGLVAIGRGQRQV
jgi:ABC-2 type transport system permease protein